MNKPTLIPYILRSRADHYCKTMAQLAGVDPVAESRCRAVVTARTLVAYKLLLDGFTEHAVGATLGWDHSTINHYRNTAPAMLKAPGYDAERELWQSFNQAI